jgi:hypothetical protein
MLACGVLTPRALNHHRGLVVYKGPRRPGGLLTPVYTVRLNLTHCKVRAEPPCCNCGTLGLNLNAERGLNVGVWARSHGG